MSFYCFILLEIESLDVSSLEIDEDDDNLKS